MNPRHLLTVAGVGLAAVLLVAQFRQLLADPTVWPPDDFVEYWAAARLTLDGQNPYDPKLLLPLQQHAGRDTQEAIMMWNPPWTIPVILPLGLFPAREAQILWLVVNLLTMGFCGDRLWVLSGGSRARRRIGWVIAIAFLPTMFALHSGQIGPILLLGAVLFLECVKRGWPGLAGAATLLLAIKPHLAYLVWVAIACDALARRRSQMIVGGLIAGLVATLLPLALNTQLLHQYADAMANRPPSQWVTPTIGTLLRMAFGEQLFRLQIVSVVVGLGWFARHWLRAGWDWDWTTQLPLIILVSFVTAPYGAWPFDMVLLLPAVICLVVRALEGTTANDVRSEAPLSPPPLLLRNRRSQFVLGSLVAINLGCLVMNICHVHSFPFIWVSPAVLVVYVAASRRASAVRSVPPRPAPSLQQAVPA